MKLQPPSRCHQPSLVFLTWLALAFALGPTSAGTAALPPVDSPVMTWRYPQNDLGAVYSPAATTLKLWSPTATSVAVELFPDATSPATATNTLTRDPNGLWSATLPGNLDGQYYLYQVALPGADTTPPAVVEVNDPYAHGCSANSGRTLIYDPRKTDPPGWDQDRFVTLAQNADAILYELHVRDFSIHPSSGITARGKFLGLVETGTRSPEGEKTGLDHLVELGVTHVHLLPVNDYAGGDEHQPAGGYTWYDWGYDPVLYQTPAGSYASDPDGTARQQEFKRTVQVFHQHHLGVVLDVVFNHTAATGFSAFSIFDKTFPGYYYRTDASGNYANASGCGNEFASERPMARKLIVDTIRYWLTEYHADGFRFDLMGLLDRDTMLEVYRAAKAINPSCIIYGEGWDMEQVLPASRMMTQTNVRGTGIAAFNDGIRDNIKGDAGNGPAPGFVQGAGAPYGGLAQFCLNIKGQSTGRGTPGIPVASPNETINYDSVHDDLCLWDKLQASAPGAPEARRIRMDKLAAGLLLTAQGVPFIQAGDEFLRAKNGNANSYNNNDPGVNPVNWSLKAQHRDVFAYYRGLIQLRRAHPAFRLASRSAVDAALAFAPNPPKNLVAYVLRNHAGGDSWNNILVVGNGSAQARDLPVTGDWTIVANDRQAGVAPLARVQDHLHVEPYSLVIAHTAGEGNF